jgi:hypothetical protein
VVSAALKGTTRLDLAPGIVSVTFPFSCSSMAVKAPPGQLPRLRWGSAVSPSLLSLRSSHSLHTMASSYGTNISTQISQFLRNTSQFEAPPNFVYPLSSLAHSANRFPAPPIFNCPPSSLAQSANCFSAPPIFNRPPSRLTQSANHFSAPQPHIFNRPPSSLAHWQSANHFSAPPIFDRPLSSLAQSANCFSAPPIFNRPPS